MKLLKENYKIIICGNCLKLRDSALIPIYCV